MDDFDKLYLPVPDTTLAEWVVERCVGPRHTLHSIIPAGFSSYIRICHPGWQIPSIDSGDEKAWKELWAGWVDSEKMHPIRWHEVAVMRNIIPDRLMHWYQICPPTNYEQGSEHIVPPLEGEMTQLMMKSIFNILCNHGNSDQEVICGFWEGYGNFDYAEIGAKLMSLPGEQNYFLFKSTLRKVKKNWAKAYETAIKNHRNEVAGLVPNVIWPTSTEWYLTSPYNLQSSYFGGSKSLVQMIMRNKEIESYEALASDNIYGTG